MIAIVIEGDAAEYEYRSAEHKQEWYSSGRNHLDDYRAKMRKRLI